MTDTTIPSPGGPASRAAIAIWWAGEEWNKCARDLRLTVSPARAAQVLSLGPGHRDRPFSQTGQPDLPADRNRTETIESAATLAKILVGPATASIMAADLKVPVSWVHVAAVLAGVTPAVANARTARTLTAPSEYREKVDPVADLWGYLLLVAAGIPRQTVDGYQAHGHDACAVIQAEASGLDPDRGLRALDLLAANGTRTATVPLHFIDQAIRDGTAAGLDDPTVLVWKGTLQGWDFGEPVRYWPLALPRGWTPAGPEAKSWTRAVLKRWVTAAGPDGWAWAAAGYTPDETEVLRALPETHPDRPGPDQLTVMAALRGHATWTTTGGAHDR